MVLSPCPCVSDRIVTQLDRLAAVHPHSRATPILTVPVPPSGPNDDVELVTAAWHRALVGAVTLVVVDAEPPHAAAANAATTIS